MGIFERIAPWLGKQLQMPSGGFGRVLGRLMAREHRALNDWAIPQLGIQAGDRVLDVGCGSGVLVRLISGLVPQGFVAGIDHSPTMVRQSLGLNAAGVADGNVSISLGEVENLHFKDESFDKVSAVETFIFWRDPLGGLRVPEDGWPLSWMPQKSLPSAKNSKRPPRLSGIRCTPAVRLPILPGLRVSATRPTRWTQIADVAGFASKPSNSPPCQRRTTLTPPSLCHTHLLTAK